ncbi:hypothetical protein HPB47_015892, partial [Ixodes persulcatus]
VKTAASTRTRDTHQAEEVAIALAIANPGCKTVLSDSRTAVLSYAKGRVCSAAARILRAAEEAGRQGAVVIKWFPAHMGSDVSGRGNTNHNETANAVARGLTNRATAKVALSEGGAWYSFKDRMTTYNEIRGEAVIFRQLQTGSLLTPVLAKYIYPGLYADDTCRLCMKARATAVHVLWDCEKNPREATEQTAIPPQFEASARSCHVTPLPLLLRGHVTWGEEGEFRRNFRLQREPAYFVIERYERSAYYRGSIHGGSNPKTAEVCILSFLWYAGNKTCIRDAAGHFDMGESTLSRILNRVAEFLCSIAPDEIRFPDDVAALAKDFEELRFVSGSPGVVGCVDGSYIGIRCPDNKVDSRGSPEEDLPGVSSLGCRTQGARTH